MTWGEFKEYVDEQLRDRGVREPNAVEVHYIDVYAEYLPQGGEEPAGASDDEGMEVVVTDDCELEVFNG